MSIIMQSLTDQARPGLPRLAYNQRCCIRHAGNPPWAKHMARLA